MGSSALAAATGRLDSLLPEGSRATEGAWRFASRAYARGAKGPVDFVFGPYRARPTVWELDEFPILQARDIPINNIPTSWLPPLPQ